MGTEEQYGQGGNLPHERAILGFIGGETEAWGLLSEGKLRPLGKFADLRVCSLIETQCSLAKFSC